MIFRFQDFFDHSREKQNVHFVIMITFCHYDYDMVQSPNLLSLFFDFFYVLQFTTYYYIE